MFGQQIDEMAGCEAGFGPAGGVAAEWFAEVDTRLVAAVQVGAGARCHEAANLLQAYYNCALVYRRRLERCREKAHDAWSTLQQAKIRLRKFLSECHAC